MSSRKVFSTIAVLFTSATAAAANCPDYGQNGGSYSFSSQDVYTAKRFAAVAGGGVNLGNCGEAPGVGHVSEAPDFTLDYSRTGNYNIRLRSQGTCDTVLLVNDANGNWYWDDESGDGPDTQIVLQNPASGYIDVWIGSYNGDVCDASLDIESFDR